MTHNSEQNASERPSIESLAEIPTPTEEMWSTAVRGRRKRTRHTRTNVVTIDEELREFFPGEKAVNDALRSLAKASGQHYPSGRGGFVWEERRQSDQYEAEQRTVVIHNDVEPYFPTAEAVNTALRAASEVLYQLEARRV